MCYRVTNSLLRYRTAWRELLHPLPIKARQYQWMKRDKTEVNEALLRQPYYTIKTYNLPAYVNKAVLFGNNGALSTDGFAGLHMSDRKMDQYGPHRATYGVEKQLKSARHAISPQRLQELRQQLQFPVRTGPEIPRMVKRRKTKSTQPTVVVTASETGTNQSNTNSEDEYEAVPSFTDEYGARLRPRYPESWDTVPQHKPSRVPM